MHDTPPERPAPPRGLSTRARFLTAGGAGVAALVAAACGSLPAKKTPGGSNANTGAGLGTDLFGPGDAGILGYAITLEYVEADFYRAALASGRLSGRNRQLLAGFGAEEGQHLQALEAARRALGAGPVARPRTSFELGDEAAILATAASLEGAGAAAYLGQVDRIQSKALLAAALSIHSVEARHAAAINELVGSDPSPDGPFARAQAASDTLNRVRPFIVG